MYGSFKSGKNKGKNKSHLATHAPVFELSVQSCFSPFGLSSVLSVDMTVASKRVQACALMMVCYWNLYRERMMDVS